MAGFNLPPGCSVSDIPGCGYDPPCECCGHDVDSCPCPECPVCQTFGDPNCYKEHGLKYNKEQLLGQARQRINNLHQQIADEELYIAWLQDQPEDYHAGE